MNGIIEAALDRRRMVLLVLALIFAAGSMTYATIPKESDPDVPIPTIYVTMSLEGISPEDAERLLARPVEQALRAIEGVKEVSSRATQGFASVTLEFEAGFDQEKALREVRRKVDETQAKLPADVKEPEVNEINVATQPVLRVDLSGPLPERALSKIARTLKDELQGVQGVLEVELSGNREEMLEILVDPVKMDSYGISQEELLSLFARNNRLIAAGVLDTGNGRFAVKLPGVIETLADVQSLPVKVAGDRVVKFSEIASITRSFKDPSSFARRNGQPVIGLDVRKRIGENVIETIERIKATVEQQRKHWPTSVEVNYANDASTQVREMLNDLQNGVLTAVILVASVLIGYLGWRSAALVSVAVPGSFLAGIMVIAALGMTVNIVVLFSLIMAVGMLVDDAIIVGEYADRKMCEGLSPPEAYRDATQRMAWPIIASTATRIAAFFPLLFWPGIVGGFMKYLPVTLMATLTASLVMALIFVPTLGAIFGRAGANSREEQARTAAAETGDLNSLRGSTRHYLRALTWAVDRPRTTFAIAITMLVAIYTAYGVAGTGVEFFPNTEPEGARAIIHARGDLSIHEKDTLVKEVEARVLGMTDFDSVYARVGGGGRRDAADTIGRLVFDFKDWKERRPAAVVLDDVRARTAGMPGIGIEIDVDRNGPTQGKPVEIKLSSPLPETLVESNARLSAAVDALRAGMTAVGGFTDVEDTRALPGIEWQLTVDRAEAARYGADVSLVGNAVLLVTNGVLLGKYRPEDAEDELDIRARYTTDARNLGQLANLRVQTRNGLVPVSNFVKRKAAQKVNAIQRSDLRRLVRVEANVAAGFLADTQVKALKAYFEEKPYAGFTDGTVQVSFAGDQEEQDEASAFLKKAFGLAVFIMLAILVTQFNSFYQTVLILSAVLFSTAAVLLGLMILRLPFGIVMGGIGVIALAGIIVNNNIILIDTFNHLRREGMDAREALLRTGVLRLRPVMLTAGTAILGLLPLAFALNIDLIHRVVTYNAPSSQFWVQLASAIAGGLAFATPITLILTPALLMWRENRVARRQRTAAISTRPTFRSSETIAAK